MLGEMRIRTEGLKTCSQQRGNILSEKTVRVKHDVKVATTN